MTYYHLEDAVDAGIWRTKNSPFELYIYAKPSINGLFVDWELSGLLYTDKKPTCKVFKGEVTYID